DRTDLEMDVEAVYRIDNAGRVMRVLSQKEIDRPNGIVVAPDDRTLYVIDSHPRAGGNRKVWAFDLAADGSPSGRRVVYDFGRGRGGDGMRSDGKGTPWVAAGINKPPANPGESPDVPAGVYVISPAGKLLGRIPIPEDLTTNVAFGGPGRKTLYVTAGKTLYRFPVNGSGHAGYPPLGRQEERRQGRGVAHCFIPVHRRNGEGINDEVSTDGTSGLPKVARSTPGMPTSPGMGSAGRPRRRTSASWSRRGEDHPAEGFSHGRVLP